MKKIIIAATGIALATSLTGCNSCTMAVKNLESNYTELHRDVVVLNPFNGDTLFTYSGPCYFKTDTSGSVSLIYTENGRSKKADFVGTFVFKAIEK